MDDFFDEMDDEQADGLLGQEEEDGTPQLYEHFRFVADRGQSLLRVDKFLVERYVRIDPQPDTTRCRSRMYPGKR